MISPAEADYGAAMRHIAPAPLALILAALPLTAAPAQVKAPRPRAAVRTATPARTAAPAPADTTIIPLPLQPIVPAAQRSCMARTATGLGYTMLRPATGAKPAADATVLVNYIGYLAATGAVFDQNTQTPMPVADVIPGFSQGLQMVGRGGVIRLCIPAALGYGARVSGPIPANSDLVFQVELLDFKTAAEIDAMRKAASPDAAPAASATPAPATPKP
ncbi:FKBP-type peptidyl-prolyl cis-trans isomerase [Sphingomonas sp. MA1305]|uniref:FKBP-type peptidyl-prolyl cis-trans isomerase n=1 Tax=Sphingomonas sp. MA1305 TaxID=2479204 RepID=UPI001E472F3D|nr:FKBP-type peptidyl-prolyl cis-trans isomerase [Sphingomonas sp. MA1305]